MKNSNAVITLCLLVCSTGVAETQSKLVKSGQQRATLHEPAFIQSTHTETKNLKKEVEDLKGIVVQKLETDGTYNSVSIDYVNNINASDVESKVTKNTYKAMNLKKITNVSDNILLNKNNSDEKTEENKMTGQSKNIWENWSQIPEKNNPETNYNAIDILIRDKRELNETHPNNEESTDEPLDSEALPEPEGLAWVGPMRHANQGLHMQNVPSNVNVLGQRAVNYQNRLPPKHLGTSASSPMTYRYQPHSQHRSNNPNLNRMNTPLINSRQTSISNSHGAPQNINSVSRQFYTNESPNTPPYPSGPRFRDIPGHPQQNYYPASAYPASAYPSLGSAGASLLNMLNPLNLFRPRLPPPLPQNPNPVPPPGYDPRRPRQPLEHSVPNDSFEGKENDQFDYVADYDIIGDDLPHEYGHEYMKDSPLRDDIYVGKDGNLYISDNQAGKEQNSYSQTILGNGYKPYRRPPYRPGKTPPRGRFEEENTAYDFNYDDNYEDLLKNHNMNEDRPREPPASVQNYFPRNPNNYNTNSLSSQLDYDDFENSNVQNPTQPTQPSGPLNWLPTFPGRINYPSYFYAPRQVVLPGLQYRPRQRRPLIPPRAGTPVIPPNVRTPVIPPNVRTPVIPPNVRTPVIPPNVRFPGRPPHLPPRASSNYPQHVKPNISTPNLNRQTTSYNATKNKLPQTPSQPGSNRVQNGHGFYPGNGFFDADFPSLYNMSPSQGNRGIERLPRPQYQNGTILADEQNITPPVHQNKTMAVDDAYS